MKQARQSAAGFLIVKEVFDLLLKKAFSVICSAALMLSTVGGCQTAAGSERAVAQTAASTTAQPNGAADETSEAMLIWVQSVEGSQVTGLSGAFGRNGRPDGEAWGRGGDRKDLPKDANAGQQKDDSGAMGAPDDTSIPEMPDEASLPERPDEPASNGRDGNRRGRGGANAPGNQSTPPDGQPGADGATEMNPQGEAITFILTDATVIRAEQEDGSKDTATAEDIVAGSMLEVTLDDDNQALTVLIRNRSMDGFGKPQPGRFGQGQPDGFGTNGSTDNGTAAETITQDGEYSATVYQSSGDDENALRIDGATVTLSDVTVEKTGGASSNTESGDFYGMNAALLAQSGATVTISNATVNTAAVNGNGVFAYGSGTTVNISDSTIRTTQRNSGGIQTTGGASMHASNLDIETQGASAAAIRSDRGGGTVTVVGGSYVTNGTGSPAIYSTADISVEDATLTAHHSEAVVVEGKNSVALKNCTVSGSMSSVYGDENGENIHNIMLYQSMSGDAEVGHSSFSAEGGSIAAKSGDMFYVTNTTCTISLTNVELALANDTLLTVAGNDSARGWGTAGSNGGTCTFLASGQTLTGAVTVDDISALEMSLTNGSAFTGTINSVGAAGDVTLTMDETSAWTLTGDSYLSAFEGDASQIITNGFAVYVAGQAITK